MEPVVQLLSELVAIPSMNPMGRLREGREYCEEDLARYVLDYLRACGLEAGLEYVAPRRPNVTGFLDAGADQTIMLEAHLDTVLADHMTVEPFRPSVQEGKLYGRGACDTKGAMAAFLHTLRRAASGELHPRVNLLFLAVADEEYRFSGALHATRTLRQRPACALIGEPTGLRIVRAHKGVTRWRIVTHGRAAHSAYPERGANAIYTMGHVLERLEAYAASLLEASPHQLLGTPTLSVGVIEGGQAVNIVPDRCTIEVDRRTLPDESADRVLEDVRRQLDGLPGWSFDPPHLSVAGMEVPPDAGVIRLLEHAIREVLGSAVIESAQYATDAGVYNAVGIPSIVFGPGDIAQAHTGAEYIELQQLLDAVRILERMITQ